MGKSKDSKIMIFLKISCEAEIYTIPKPRDSEFPYSKTTMVKHRQFPGYALPYRFRVNGNPCNHQSVGMWKFPYHGNILWKPISFPGCGFVRKVEFITKFKQYPEHEQSKMSKGKTALFPHMDLERFFLCLMILTLFRMGGGQKGPLPVFPLYLLQT